MRLDPCKKVSDSYLAPLQRPGDVDAGGGPLGPAYTEKGLEAPLVQIGQGHP